MLVVMTCGCMAMHGRVEHDQFTATYWKLSLANSLTVARVDVSSSNDTFNVSIDGVNRDEVKGAEAVSRGVVGALKAIPK